MNEFLNLWQSSGIYQVQPGQIIMLMVCLLLLFLAIRKNFEPLLLVPIGFGGLLANIPGAGPVDIVAHSMGGLIARTYVAEHGGDVRVARLLSAGTPWRGSVQVFQLLEGGWGLANSFMGGLEAFRRTVIGFPSTLEMLPDYDGCCGGAADGFRFDAARPAAWGALHWAGIEPLALPDLAAAAVRQQRLRRIVATPLPDGIEEALVIGVDQRTPDHYQLRTGDGEARLTVSTSWEGDGTVVRDSAVLPRHVTYRTSFATHDAILNDALVQDFVLAALADGPETAQATVPVRERSSILTALGELVELVGVAVATDRPLYRIGETAQLTVHLRLDTTDPVDADAITVRVMAPGGIAAPVALASDPAASDPATPLEQSFSGRFATGAIAGDLAITATLTTPGAEPRVVTRLVPVRAP